jgi:Rrf2 family protein
MRALATASIWVSGDELAATVGTSRGFLVQVMAPLVRARWVQSTPGPQGGYRIRSSSPPVSVLDVIEATEGPLETASCVLEPDRDCAIAHPETARACALHEPWLAARTALRADLARRSIVTTDSRKS